MSIKTCALLGILLCSQPAETKTIKGAHHARQQTTHADKHVTKPRPVKRQRFTSFPDEVQASRKPDISIDWGLGDLAITNWWLFEEIPRQMEIANQRWETFITRAKKYPDTMNGDK